MRLGTKGHSNSRIQFASNQSKLVPRKLDPRPSSKVGLSRPTSPYVMGGLYVSHFNVNLRYCSRAIVRIG